MEMIDVLQKLKEIQESNPGLVDDAVNNVVKTNPQDVNTNLVQSKTDGLSNEGGMSDVHIGAQEVLADYVDEEGNLAKAKTEVLADLQTRRQTAKFPESYEIETAIELVQNEFEDNGFRMDKEAQMDMANKESNISINTTTMKTEGKKPIKEAITMTADSPEEAGMLMQIMKLAGVQQVTPDMMGAEPSVEPEAEACPTCGEPDCDGGNEKHTPEISSMRDMIAKAHGDETQEETYANEPNEKVDDVDTLVNVHSGGLNRKKQSFARAEPGDNPLAVKEVTEEDLSNSLRNQYESFKTAYTEAAKPDFLDLDKDGDKKEPMSKAADEKGDDKKDDSKGLTAAQKKLPAGLQKAIAKKNS